MSIRLVTMNEGTSQIRLSGLNRAFRISPKQLLVLILIILIGSTSFFWASDRIATHERWASELEMLQQFSTHFIEVYVRLPSITENVTTDPTHFWFLSELDYAQWTLNQLINGAHTSELYTVEDLIHTLYESGTNGVKLNDSQFWNLSNTFRTIAQKLPRAYWNPLNSTSVDSRTGPPFWYLGPSPPYEATLQQVATLATYAKGIVDY
jgi:hypothetical protein